MLRQSPFLYYNRRQLLCEQFLSALPATLIQGLIYALISFGVYITYSILDFPDLGVDGTFPLGAAVTAVLLTQRR